MANESFFTPEDLLEEDQLEYRYQDKSSERYGADVNSSKADISKVVNSRCQLTTADEILEAYEEKLEFKDDKEIIIQNVSVVGLSDFAPKANPNEIRKAVEKFAWKTLGYCKDENEDDPVPDSPAILFTTVTDLLKQPDIKLDLMCPLLNQVLDGGLRCSTVTEITGESGSGKSQVCLHSACAQALQGHSVIYLQTEASFPLSRLSQILSERCETEEEMEESMNRIFIKKIQTYSLMQSVLNNDIEVLIKEKCVKLIILDSITAIIRGDKDIEDVSERTDVLSHIGQRLQDLCHEYKLSVLVVNQVSSAIDFPGHTYGRKVIPSLGPSWTAFINTRLFVSKSEYLVGQSQIPGLQNDASLRSIEVDFSSFLEESFFNFIVTPSGILGINIT